MRKTLIPALLACLASLSLPAFAAPRHVIVVVMENKDSVRKGDQSRNYIYGNAADAPFINGPLTAGAARATNFNDDLPSYNSQPHYMLMEAGTNKFADATFTCDNDPLQKCRPLGGQQNWTKSSDHLVSQIAAAHPALTWMTYQEDIAPGTTGACPIHSAGHYVAKHNPFVYFADVAGSPPAADNATCIAHTRPLQSFAGDMTSGRLANYVFVTPNLCHDMHGAFGCRSNAVKEGDDFLRSFLPPVTAWAQKNDAVVFVMWDEGKRGLKLPFYAAGAGARTGYDSKVEYSHRSVVKTIEQIFGLPVLDSVKGANDLSDMFAPGALH